MVKSEPSDGARNFVLGRLGEIVDQDDLFHRMSLIIRRLIARSLSSRIRMRVQGS